MGKNNYLSEPKLTDNDSWWTGRNRIITFASLTEAHSYWQRMVSGAIPTPDQVKEKIAELELRIKEYEDTIDIDKATYKCLNYDVFYEKINVLSAQKLALSWVLGETTYL
jgi:hypothetical protein